MVSMIAHEFKKQKNAEPLTQGINHAGFRAT